MLKEIGHDQAVRSDKMSTHVCYRLEIFKARKGMETNISILSQWLHL